MTGIIDQRRACFLGRTYKTIPGVTYATLDAALRRLGYVREETEEGINYENATEPKARILFPRLPLTAEVRGIDFVATRAILAGFGIADANELNLLLARAGNG